ncbi:MAG: CorA family divalent cation transporter [Chloroflexota bacterium]
MTSDIIPAPTPGRATVTRLHAGEIEEWTDGAALDALANGLLAETRAAAPGSCLWIDLTDPTPAQVEHAAGLLGLHPLIAEDIVEGNQRPKLEATDDVVHIVLFALDDAAGFQAHEIDLVLGAGFLLSAHPVAWDPRDGSHFRNGPAAIMEAGPDHLLWALIDAIVDAYFPFADRLEDTIDALQDAVIERTDRSTLNQVFALKRHLIEIRRAISPVREVLNQLTNRDLALIDAEELLYFRDVYDHVIRLTDELDNDRELVTATLDVYLSQVNNNLSAIMKRLTGVTVIIAGIGAVAGIFGMSEAGLAFSGGEAAGFWMVTAIAIAIAATAALILRKIGWI